MNRFGQAPAERLQIRVSSLGPATGTPISTASRWLDRSHGEGLSLSIMDGGSQVAEIPLRWVRAVGWRGHALLRLAFLGPVRLEGESFDSDEERKRVVRDALLGLFGSSNQPCHAVVLWGRLEDEWLIDAACRAGMLLDIPCEIEPRENRQLHVRLYARGPRGTLARRMLRPFPPERFGARLRYLLGRSYADIRGRSGRHSAQAVCLARVLDGEAEISRDTAGLVFREVEADELRRIPGRFASDPVSVAMRISRGDRCFVAIADDWVISRVWACGDPDVVATACGERWRGTSALLLYDAKTRPAKRGRGIYPSLRRWVMRRVHGEYDVIIVRNTNRATVRSAIEAGFERVEVQLGCRPREEQRENHVTMESTGPDLETQGASRLVEAQELLRLRLATGVPLWLRCRGTSMAPLLIDGDSVRLLAAPARLRRGDVVLFNNRGGLVLHRIERISGGRMQTRGDSCSVSDSPISRAEVIGWADGRERHGRVTALTCTLRLGPAPLLRFARTVAARGIRRIKHWVYSDRLVSTARVTGAHGLRG